MPQLPDKDVVHCVTRARPYYYAVNELLPQFLSLNTSLSRSHLTSYSQESLTNCRGRKDHPSQNNFIPWTPKTCEEWL